MVQAVGARWHIEELFEAGKAMGLDHHARPQFHWMVPACHLGSAHACIFCGHLRSGARGSLILASSLKMRFPLLGIIRGKTPWILTRHQCFYTKGLSLMITYSLTDCCHL